MGCGMAAEGTDASVSLALLGMAEGEAMADHCAFPDVPPAAPVQSPE